MTETAHMYHGKYTTSLNKVHQLTTLRWRHKAMHHRSSHEFCTKGINMKRIKFKNKFKSAMHPNFYCKSLWEGASMEFLKLIICNEERFPDLQNTHANTEHKKWQLIKLLNILFSISKHSAPPCSSVKNKHKKIITGKMTNGESVSAL